MFLKIVLPLALPVMPAVVLVVLLLLWLPLLLSQEELREQQLQPYQHVMSELPLLPLGAAASSRGSQRWVRSKSSWIRCSSSFYPQAHIAAGLIVNNMGPQSFYEHTPNFVTFVNIFIMSSTPHTEKYSTYILYNWWSGY